MVSKNCVIYARVSPTKHMKEYTDLHASLEEALIICRRNAENEGYTVIKEYVDEYISGKDSKQMKSFNSMLSDAKNKQFTRVYTRRVNRFGRNRNDMLRAQIELEELNISLKFVENGIDTAQPFGKSMMAILAELAQMEREQILEDTRRGREAAKLRGQPFGPKEKDLKISLKLVRKLRLLPASDTDRPTWEKLESMTGVTRSTIISKLKKAGYWDYTNKCVK